MKRNSKVVIVGISITAIIFLSLFSSQALAYKYKKDPYWPDWDKWREASPESQGMNSEEIQQMFDFIKLKEINLHSVTIVRNGYIVNETYLKDGTYIPSGKKSYEWPGHTPDWDLHEGRLHHVFSVTKSVVSLLTGIAIEMGFLDLDTKFFDVFPDKWKDEYVDNSEYNLGDAKKDITVENLLIQNVGIAPWDDGDPDWWVSLENPVLSINYYLTRNMTYIPGALVDPIYGLPAWTYSSANGDLLSVMIANRSGMMMEDFARKYLFKPLKIRDSEWWWWATPSEWGKGDLAYKNQGGFGLFLSPQAMARIGLMCLNNGKWRGRQVVPEEWIAVSTREHINPFLPAPPYFHSYGYKWWVTPGQYYQAFGANSQRIIVIPEYNIVVVFTANDLNDLFGWLGPFNNYLVDTYIIPAVLA